MAMRSIQLRWRGRCCRCGRIMPAGETAEFDTDHHELWCTRCSDGQLPLLIEEALEPVAVTKAPKPSPVERAQIRALIDETKAQLDAHRRAG